MSQSTRTERRHGSHNPGKPPAKRDPMLAVYIGIGVAVVAVFLAIGIFNWHGQQVAIAAAATPTPGPNASAKPIQLADAVSIGKPAFPPGNTKDGGAGAKVDGIQCETQERVTLHNHTHLALFDNGVQMQVPQFIGLVPTLQCLYWLHTHATDGIIHIEAPDFTAPNGGPYTLGMFFDIWGEPLTRSQIARFKGPVTVYVNGGLYTGDLHAIPLLAHQQITLEVGKTVPPPNYIFPLGE